ncbi:hypothetical protein B0T19DRAFT_435133 [Cercophora scortea]|uniref:Uncharacterized protein n=1 Tax=Cercophora scortea TaxID=314031 RepID=A0AAE0M328_9PEZI|nr:hypothetical protein B0T19DRAFT_435133 [Cercophora scortea]
MWYRKSPCLLVLPPQSADACLERFAAAFHGCCATCAFFSLQSSHNSKSRVFGATSRFAEAWLQSWTCGSRQESLDRQHPLQRVFEPEFSTSKPVLVTSTANVDTQDMGKTAACRTFSRFHQSLLSATAQARPHKLPMRPSPTSTMIPERAGQPTSSRIVPSFRAIPALS